MKLRCLILGHQRIRNALKLPHLYIAWSYCKHCGKREFIAFEEMPHRTVRFDKA